jgi:hypothetical protein
MASATASKSLITMMSSMPSSAAKAARSKTQGPLVSLSGPAPMCPAQAMTAPISSTLPASSRNRRAAACGDGLSAVYMALAVSGRNSPRGTSPKRALVPPMSAVSRYAMVAPA